MPDTVIAALIGLGGFVGLAVGGAALKFALKMTGGLARVEMKVDGLQTAFYERTKVVDKWMNSFTPQSQEADD